MCKRSYYNYERVVKEAKTHREKHQMSKLARINEDKKHLQDDSIYAIIESRKEHKNV